MALHRASLFLFLMVIFPFVWASASAQASISVSPSNPDADGRVAVVESIFQTVTMTWSKARRIVGVSIFKISHIAPGTANRLLIKVLLLNPYDMNKVFGNPHTYINVTVSDSHNTTGNVYAWGILSREHAEVLLRPQGVPSDKTTLYIQISIIVPGGRPPGQQEKQNLQYYCIVELR